MKKEIEHLVAEIGKKKAEIRNEALKSAMSVKRIRVLADNCLELNVRLTNLRRECKNNL